MAAPITLPLCQTIKQEETPTKIENQDDQGKEVDVNPQTQYSFFKYYVRKKNKQQTVIPQPQTTNEDTNSSGNPRKDLRPERERRENLPVALRKEPKTCVKPLSYEILDFLAYKGFLTNLSQLVIPKTVEEALIYHHWRSAMNEEMKALTINKTWDVVERIKDKKLLGCRWIFTVKYKSDGSLERYKARLVAKGYTQTYGIDYKETFTHAAKMNTIRILISIMVNLDWNMQQYDIKNAFLHRNLDEEIICKFHRVRKGH